MFGIKNFVVKDGIVEYDYYVENNPDEMGHMVATTAGDIISNKRNPIDEKDGKDFYGKWSLEFALRMIKTGETERLFCFY